MSILERCPYFRGVHSERFHCTVYLNYCCDTCTVVAYSREGVYIVHIHVLVCSCSVECVLATCIL